MRKNVYVKRNISRNVRLNRQLPSVPPGGGMRNTMHRYMAHRAKERIKTVHKRGIGHITRRVDPYEEDEVHHSLQSLQLPRDGVRKARNMMHYTRNFSEYTKKVSNYIQNRKRHGRSVTISARRVKSGVTAQGRVHSGVNAIKTLNSKYVPNGKYAFLGKKTGLKKAGSVTANYIKMAAQQVVKKLLIAVAANPKVWIVGGIIGAIFFLVMMLTNSLGGMTTTSAGAYFMTDKENARQYKAEVESLNNEFQAKIQQLSHSSSYDDVRTEYMNEDGAIHANWIELLAVLAVYYEQDLKITDEQREYMKNLYDYFNVIQTFTETYTENVCITDDEGEQTCKNVTRTRLIIRVYTYDMEDVFTRIGFTDEQQEWARRLVTSGAIQEQFPDLAYALPGGGYGPGTGVLDPEELADLINNLGGNIGAARRKIVETAITLEGKVGYFWGGKSSSGWNNLWGALALVTSPGSEKTGTYQPYGLDCSGFVDWVYKTAALGSTFSAGGTSYQWSKTYEIRADEMLPGDLIFKNIPGQGGINHIGIFIGRDSNGIPLFVHCQSSTGVIINSYKGFKYPRRPLLFQGGG